MKSVSQLPNAETYLGSFFELNEQMESLMKSDDFGSNGEMREFLVYNGGGEYSKCQCNSLAEAVLQVYELESSTQDKPIVIDKGENKEYFYSDLPLELKLAMKRFSEESDKLKELDDEQPNMRCFTFYKKDSDEEVSFLFAVSEIEALSELALLSVTLGASLSDLLNLEFTEKETGK